MKKGGSVAKRVGSSRSEAIKRQRHDNLVLISAQKAIVLACIVRKGPCEVDMFITRQRRGAARRPPYGNRARINLNSDVEWIKYCNNARKITVSAGYPYRRGLCVWNTRTEGRSHATKGSARSLSERYHVQTDAHTWLALVVTAAA
ncbi:unnamed protein product, partial [Iphiclides podalirius]